MCTPGLLPRDLERLLEGLLCDGLLRAGGDRGRGLLRAGGGEGDLDKLRRLLPLRGGPLDLEREGHEESSLDSELLYEEEDEGLRLGLLPRPCPPAHGFP